MAGENPQRIIADFDRHYMPDSIPELEVAADAHRSGLKRKAEGISRSLCEFFAYLTYNTQAMSLA
jgi:hypothetical protein